MPHESNFFFTLVSFYICNFYSLTTLLRITLLSIYFCDLEIIMKSYYLQKDLILSYVKHNIKITACKGQNNCNYKKKT